MELWLLQGLVGTLSTNINLAGRSDFSVARRRARSLLIPRNAPIAGKTANKAENRSAAAPLRENVSPDLNDSISIFG
jgi:hypothetical protein